MNKDEVVLWAIENGACSEATEWLASFSTLEEALAAEFDVEWATWAILNSGILGIKSVLYPAETSYRAKVAEASCRAKIAKTSYRAKIREIIRSRNWGGKPSPSEWADYRKAVSLARADYREVLREILTDLLARTESLP